MCGIAGYFGTEEIPRERIENCLNRMQRRGPDHAAFHRWKNPAGRNALLLHTRLSIIDLDSRSNQPFQVDSKWLVYNGELYNYLELKEELMGRGVIFTTGSDTEVLLRAIHEEGWEVLDRCEGMWAFALYDEKEGTLTLCRDRFGEKPLYLYEDSKGLYFGSEVKFIAALRGKPLKVNWDQLYRYLVNGYKALYKGSETFFEQLREVPPAHVLRLDSEGGKSQWRYWEPKVEADRQMSYPEAVEESYQRLLRSMELRLRADRPLAFCMSGGIDSNALIGIAKKVFGYDVHGFTIMNSDRRYDEKELVEESVRELKIRHTAIPVDTTRFLPRLRELIRYHDAPVYTITYYAQWLLMEAVAAQGYRISVSGTAADELFTGYYDHHLAYLAEVRHNPELYTRSRGAWEERVRPFVRNPHLKDPELFVLKPEFRDHIYLNAQEFAGYLTDGWLEPFQERTFTRGLLRNRMLNELFHEAVPVILHEDDLNAMSFSIENRSPYLDRELFEFCSRIPTFHLIQEGLSKAVLRDAVKGIVPERIRTNPRKVGFNAPIHSFLDVQDPQVRQCLLEDGAIFEHVRREKIQALIEKRDLPNSESKFLFYFVSAKIFLEEFEAA